MALSRHASWSRVRQRDHEGLTPMERKVVDYERSGMSRPVIAAVTGLASSTVAYHIWMAHQRGARLRNPIREQPRTARASFDR